MDESIGEKLLCLRETRLPNITYNKLADEIDHEGNRKILRKVGEEKKENYKFWRQYTEGKNKISSFRKGRRKTGRPLQKRKSTH